MQTVELRGNKLEGIFQPITINGLVLKNRIVMPAMGTRFATDTGAVSQRLIDFHVERAKGGTGLQIVEQSFVNEKRPHCMLSISHDKYLPGLGDLTDAVHDEGGKIGIQIGNLGFPEHLVYSHQSQIDRTHVSQVRKYIREFADAAGRARDASFDAVEIHGAHRYLISQFLSPQTNHRKDKYGGSLEGRMTFLLEILRMVRERVGKGFPVLVRINGDGFDPKGHGLKEAKVIAKALEAEGADAIDISAGSWKSPERTVPPMYFPRGCHVYLAKVIKGEIRLPVIIAGRINDPVLADEIIREGKADLVAMGRALIADPLLPKKAINGDLGDIRPCIACNYCHWERVYMNKRLKCSVNANVGREREYELRRAKKPKKVIVVGGGPAGMEASWTLKARGHQVTLVEKKAQLGGQLLLAARPPHKDEVRTIISWLSSQVKKQGVKVILRCEINAQFLSDSKADIIVFATGSLPSIPQIPGLENIRHISARDVLSNVRVRLGPRIAIIGGGRLGCETAEHLRRKGKEVTIVEKLEKLACDMEPRSRGLLLERLEKLGIIHYCQTEIIGITYKGISMRDNIGLQHTLSVDVIVLASGSEPQRDLLRANMDFVKLAYLIGDCDRIGDISNAIHAGAHVGHLL